MNTFGLKKSVLVLTTQLTWWFIIDSENQAICIPARKIQSFVQLREYNLAHKNIDENTLQRFQGKCILFPLTVKAVSCILEISVHLLYGSLSSEEVAHWRFLDTWAVVVPWREEKDVRLSISTDASNNFGWGCVVHHPSGDQWMAD